MNNYFASVQRFCLLTVLILTITFSAFAESYVHRVKPGIEVLLEDSLHCVKGKRIGLITNPTGVTSELKSTIDVLKINPDITLAALFGPEHGVRGDVQAGVTVKNFIDERTGVPVYSLYGSTKKPTPEMLKGIDILVFDIQDVGSRAYTYIYTMAYAMQAAAENHIPFIVLDRPNPLGGELIEGPVLDSRFKSFIGMYEIPYVYGLTIGELALYFNTEFNINADVKVIPMRGWKRWMTFKDTGLAWVPTSPHVPFIDTPWYIATTGCIGELQVINEGVGYTLPFQLVGAKWINADSLADELNNQCLPGVFFRPLFYKPYYFALKDNLLQGVQIHITDFSVYKPMLTQLNILAAIIKMYPGMNVFNPTKIEMFDKAMGVDSVRKNLTSGFTVNEIYEAFNGDLERYKTKRLSYLLYN